MWCFCHGVIEEKRKPRSVSKRGRSQHSVVVSVPITHIFKQFTFAAAEGECIRNNII